MRTGTALGMLIGGILGFAIAYVSLQGFIASSKPRARSLSFDRTSSVVVRGIVTHVDAVRGHFDVAVFFPGYAPGELPFRIAFDAVDQFSDRTVAAPLDGSAGSPASLTPNQMISLRIDRATGRFVVSSAVAQRAPNTP